LDRLRFSLFAVFITGLLCAQTAGAQTAAKITVLSGNGQIVCATCTNSISRFFLPMVVKVTDAAGQPIANKAVSWTLVQSQGPLPFFPDQTFTDGNGVASAFINQTSQAGSFAQQYLQNVIQASTDSVSALFYETQGLSDSQNHQLQFINARLDSPAIGVILTGTAGGTGSAPIKMHVDAFGIPITNASVRILNGGDPATTASAACATGAGADLGSVLTDQNGDATCTPIFGPVSGNSNITVLVGGVDPAASPAPELSGTAVPIGYFQSGIVTISIKAGVAGLVTVSSGNNQTVNPGQQSAPLVVKVTDSSGQNPISGASVVWTVTPVGGATFNPATSSTDAQGLASTVATLPAGAAGPVTIKASLTGALSNLSANFTLSANVVLSGLQKVSGDQQSAPAGLAFGSPLVVQVNGSNGQPVANYPVFFSVSGPATLSASTASTNASGRAQITVTAGATQGAVTVTASAGAFNQTFALTVIPPGPVLTAGGFVNGADFQRGALSPCSIATIIGPGVASTVQGVVVPTSLFGPLPYLLANVKVTFNNSQAPIYNVANVNGQQQVTVQVPCDVTPGSSVPVTVNVGGGSATINVPILPASPGVFLTTMSDGVSRIVAVRPDGSFVSIENPARRNEIVHVYVTGLGTVSPPIATNSIPVPGTDSNVTGQVIVGVNNQGTRLVSARLAQNLIGVYDVAFQVPSDATTGNDVIFSVGINASNDTQTRYSAGTKIPIL
jgi:uncharacterized protein (TIGR03437 family)